MLYNKTVESQWLVDGNGMNGAKAALGNMDGNGISAETHLTAIPRRWQLSVRLCLALMALVGIALLLGALPARLAQLQTVCADARCPAILLAPDDAAILARWGVAPTTYAVYHIAIEALLVIPSATLWWYIFRRYTHSWVGAITCAGLVYLAVSLGNIVWAWTQVAEPVAFVADVLTQIGAAALLLLLFLFPDGRPQPRWSRYAVAYLLFVAMPFGFVNLSISPGLDDNLPDLLNALSFFVLVVLGTVAQIVRFRRQTDRAQRQQTKWVVVGFSGLMLGVVLWFATMEAFPLEPGAPRLLWNVLGMPVMTSLVAAFPVLLGAAILRYRLWELDLFVNRALVYAGATLLISLVYVALIGALGTIAGREQSELAAALLATGIVAVGSRPAYQRLQRGVNRLVPAGAAAALVVVSAEITPAGSPERTARSLRLLWFAAAAGTVALLAAALPPRFAMLTADVYGNAAGLAELGVSRTFFAIYFVALELFFFLVSCGVSAVIVWKRADDRFAVLVATGLLLYPLLLPLIEGLSFADPRWAYPISALRTIMMVVLMAVWCQLPTGQFKPAWTRRLLWLWGLFSFVIWLRLPLVMADTAIAASFRSLSELQYYFVGAFFFAIATVGQIQRYRYHTDDVERLQLKWIYQGSLLVTLISIVLPFLLVQSPWMQADAGGRALTIFIWGAATLLGGLAIPLTIAFAMMRFGLWNVDLILDRTLVYGGTTGLILLLYVVLVGGLGTLLRTDNNLLLSLVVTGTVALAFLPVRAQLQQRVNRRLYGERDNPLSVLSKLGDVLVSAENPAAILPAYARTIADALLLPAVAVWMRTARDQFQPVAQVGEPPRHAETLPLVYHGQHVGQLVVAPRIGQKAFSRADMRLLTQIANQTAVAVNTVRLAHDLQQSRERLVTTREEERRRLRRDLHDGLGPVLASQGLKLSAARQLLDRRPADARRLIDEVTAQNERTVAEVRRLVYGLRPPALDELGLVGTIAQEGQRLLNTVDLQLSSHPQPFPDLPAAVEVAAYRIVLEALTNVARHARATSCEVTLHAAERLAIGVRDNGVGLAQDARDGVGLQSMRERSAELGGGCTVTSPPGGGTLVTAHIPIAGSGADEE